MVLLCACGDDGASNAVDASLADAPPDAQVKKAGLVAIVEDKAMNQTIVLGNFFVDHSTVVASRDDGSCHIEQRNTVMELPINGGTITIMGGGAGTVSVPFDPMVGGYVAQGTGLSYGPGDQLTISTSGAMVPPLSGQLVFPVRVTVTSGTPTVLHKSGFTATWDPTAGPVTIGITQYPSGAPELRITCAFDGTAGTGTIPAAALSDVLTTTSVGIGVSMQTRLMVMAGDYPVNLFAIYGALDANSVPVQP